MRVLHVYSGNLFGGIETYFVNLAESASLCPEMISEFALCFEGRLSQELAEQGAKVHFLGNVRVRYPWTVQRARRALRELLESREYDAVICHSAWCQAIFGSVVLNFQTFLIFYLHDVANGHHWIERLARRVVPDFVLCNSHFTESTLSKMYPRARRDVIFFPIAAPRELNREERLAIRLGLGADPDAVVLIQVSRMESWKGHEILLRSLGKMKSVPSWVCWIVGGPQRRHEQQYMECLRDIAAQEGIGERVLFLGQRLDVDQLLGAADIFVQPNTRPEPFGIVFAEALYAGLPVVTSNFGGGPELVDSSCGMLVPPANVSALAVELEKLVGSPKIRIDLGTAGRQRARELVDPSVQLHKLHHLLTSNVHAS